MFDNRLPLSPTKDLPADAFAGSELMRFVWRFYTQRLTRAGRWFIWPTLLFSAYGGASLQVQGYVVLSYFLAVWIVALVAIRLLRPNVSIKVNHANRFCAGETLPVDIEIQHLGRSTAMDLLVLPHHLPPEVNSEPADGVALASLSPGDRTRIRLGLSCPRRGVYRLHGYRVESDFPFALFNASRRFLEERALMVYPHFTRLSRLALPTGRRYHPGGVALASSLGESFEYIGNRDYRDGDSIRDIDWRATARLSQPIVREYRDEYYLRVAVILDTHVRKNAKAAEKEAFERAVSLSASISDFMARQEYLVDLFAAGPNLYHLTAGRSLAYLDQILDILACVQENPAEPFEIIEPEIMESLAKITTIICVFLDWDEPRRAFCHRLVQHGAGVKVITVRDAACTLDPILDGDVLGEIPVISEAQFKRGLEEL